MVTACSRLVLAILVIIGETANPARHVGALGATRRGDAGPDPSCTFGYTSLAVTLA